MILKHFESKKDKIWKNQAFFGRVRHIVDYVILC